MKRTTAILLAFVMLLGLSACSSKEEKMDLFLNKLSEQIDREIDNSWSESYLIDPFNLAYFSDAKNFENEGNKFCKDKVFEEVVIAKLKQFQNEGNYKRGFSLILGLSHIFNFKSEVVKGQFEQLMTDFKKSIFSDINDSKIIEYVALLQFGRKYAPYYYNIGDFIPYEETKNIAQQYFYNVKCESGIGGYNDGQVNRQEDYWQSPLTYEKSSYGIVGYQHHQNYYWYFGDFESSIVSAYMYGLENASNVGNYRYASLRYFGDTISDDIDTITEFLDIAKTENTYCCQAKGKTHLEDTIYLFFVFGEQNITFFISEGTIAPSGMVKTIGPMFSIDYL